MNQGGKENESPESISACLVPVALERGAMRRGSFGNPRTPDNARAIVLKALGPSPSRQALSRFVEGLSRDERRFFLGESPFSPASRTAQHVEQVEKFYLWLWQGILSRNFICGCGNFAKIINSLLTPK